VLHSSRLHVAVRCTSPRSGWPSWRILLLAGRRSESCARPGVASRVVPGILFVWSSFVCQLEGWADTGLEVAQ
jgi:hypothetical protein